MISHLARRVTFAVFLVFTVSSASLVLARLAPGTVVTELLRVEARCETVEQARLTEYFAATFSARIPVP